MGQAYMNASPENCSSGKKIQNNEVRPYVYVYKWINKGSRAFTLTTYIVQKRGSTHACTST